MLMFRRVFGFLAVATMSRVGDAIRVDEPSHSDRRKLFGAPGRIRTDDPLVRRGQN
jgi:hypothetical protein